MQDYLMHIGVKRRSGRFPWGSGQVPFQHEPWFSNTVKDLKKQGLNDEEIAHALGMTLADYKTQRIVSAANADWVEYVKFMRREGNNGKPMSEVEIARLNEMSTTEFRRINSLAKEVYNNDLDGRIYEMKAKGMSNQAIAEKIGKTDTFVGYRLKEQAQVKAAKSQIITDALKANVDDMDYIDIGVGSEIALGTNRTQFMKSVKALELQGYVKETLKVRQAGSDGQVTNIMVLAKPGTDKQELWNNLYNIGLIGGVQMNDGGYTKLGIQKPTSVDSKRILVRYNEEGGAEKDGVIEIRPGVPDLSLGKSNYAQVRIGVDGTHYMKGMAMYSNDIPKGYDIIYNSHRNLGTPLFKKDADHQETVFKSMKDDPDNPFGTTLKTEKGTIVGQRMYIDKDGKEKLSPINIVREQGDWDTWSRTLASQFLSKQPIQLIKQQLDLTWKDKVDEYNEIESLTNPVIKKKLLESFADSCESDAVHLKAKSLPGQSCKVILPFNDVKDNEIYAPTYKNGEEVVLIRYPHGGTFEMPRLIVNNKIKGPKEVIGQAEDAVGINAKTASILSGADFDGDTVVVIPTRGQNIVTQKPLKDLEGFDPQEAYPAPKGMSKSEMDRWVMKNKQTQMGKVSNLITDMTLSGAEPDEIARAVKHSMVVIDAEKHKLDYRKSEEDNRIRDLKTKYQGASNAGASTIISRASGAKEIPDRKLVYSIKGKIGEQLTDQQKEDFLAGKKVYLPTGKTTNVPIRDENNEIIGWNQKPKTVKVPQMELTDDAMTLVRDPKNPKEVAYAEFANKLKNMAYESRKEAMTIKPYTYSNSASKVYKEEVDSLNNKLKIAQMNKPLERKAQLVANVIANEKIKDLPEYDKDQVKKIKQQAISQARRSVGASKLGTQIDISDREWEAIQAGAVSSSKLLEIINNANEDQVKQLAMPRDERAISPALEAKIRTYLNNPNVTIAEIAQELGVSTATVIKYK